MKDQSQSITILLAEDDADYCTLVKKAFQKVDLDYDLFFVEDGIDLLQYLNKQGRYHSPASAPRPDLILLDLKMPRMDGRTTIRRLREQEETRHIPIVVLSANPVRDDAERAQMLGMGVRQFLNKPMTIEQLVAEVQKHLGAEQPQNVE